MKGRFLLIVLSLTGFVTSFGAYVVAANLPSYSRETGAGLIVIGFLIALYDLAEIFIKPFGALLSRKIGEWAVLRIGLALFILASGLYLALPPQWLILVRLLQGAGAAFFSVMSMTLLIRYFMERKGAVLGIYGAFKNAGYVLAPTIGGFFVYYHGFQSIFGLCAAAGLTVVILTYVIRSGLPMADASAAAKKNKKSPALKDLLDSLRNRRTLPIFLIMFFNMIFMASPVEQRAGSSASRIRACPQRSGLPGGAALCRKAFRQPGEEESHHPGPCLVHSLHFLHPLSSQPLLHRSRLSHGCGHWLCGSSR
ncbi:MAG: MFS transporter [Desulfobacterota bacterium]|nr:MFS transporter [Thermodesulfobacteriota bacterium]